MGVRHLDTAHRYLRGNSEKVIGEIVGEKGVRDQVYIGTKMRFARDSTRNVYSLEGTAREPAATEENFFRQLEISLERLRTDYVDILHLHSCYSPEMATFEPLLNALVKAKEAGKTRFIGVSTHRDEARVIRACADSGVHDVVLTAYNFMQDHRDEVKAAIEYAAGKGLGIVAMKTQGGNRLARDPNANINHRAALKWALSDPNVSTTIPGITTFDQLELDLSVMSDLELTEEEASELELASMLPGPLYCQNCRSCIPSCPSRVEIPNLMRAYMYAEGYGNLIEAENAIAGLPRDRGLDGCASCPSCTATCARSIDIGARVEDLHRMGFDRC
jgi:predicted aldo/keto reductase-like oxidoreductase